VPILIICTLIFRRGPIFEYDKYHAEPNLVDVTKNPNLFLKLTNEERWENMKDKNIIHNILYCYPI